jgi:hypothetical protein
MSLAEIERPMDADVQTPEVLTSIQTLSPEDLVSTAAAAAEISLTEHELLAIAGLLRHTHPSENWDHSIRWSILRVGYNKAEGLPVNDHDFTLSTIYHGVRDALEAPRRLEEV